MLKTYRSINVIAFLLIIALLAAAMYLQIHDKIEPCPLCIMQRVAFILTGMLFLFGCFYKAGTIGRKILHGFIYLSLLFGIALASRQIYLQHMPIGTAPSCGPGLNFIIKNLPPSEALHLIFWGTGECAKIHWRFLGLTLSEWSLFWFVFLAFINSWQFFRRKLS